MTIAIGFKCQNGIVLCTDSMESDGVTKREAIKIWAYQVAHDWGIAVASAGESDLADSFTSALPEVLGKGDYDRAAVLAKLRQAISHTRRSYPNSDLAMLIGIFNRLWYPYAELFRVMPGSVHLGPVQRHQSIGIAANLTNFLCSQLYNWGMTVEEAIRLGVFAIARAKEHVDGCGGPTMVLTYTEKDEFWRGENTEKLEEELNARGFRAAMEHYWESHNPPLKHRFPDHGDGGSTIEIECDKEESA